jgi:hypothetical protein
MATAESSSADQAPAVERSPTRELLLGAVHLAVLWAFAVVQPLLDLLGKNPDFFVARGNTRGDIILLAVVLVAVPPLLMLAVEAVALRIERRLRDGIHLALIAGLVAAIALQALDELTSGPGAVLIVAALALGAGAAVVYARTEWLPSLLTVLSPAPLIFVCAFLFFSDVKELVLPEDEVQAAGVAVPGKTPVVVILLDEFQGTMLMNAEGDIDRTLFPNFAELADRGSWYPNATTEADLTPRATPAVMTGSYPTHDELPTAADHPDSIFTLLGGDYAMNVAEPVTSVCPESLCGEKARPPASDRLDSLASDLRIVYEHLLLPESMEGSLPAVDETFSGFGNSGDPAEGEVAAGGEAELKPATPPTGDAAKAKGEVETQFNADNASFLGRGATFDSWQSELTGDRRTLNFLHLELPHVPYEFYPDGQRYAAGLLEDDGFRDSQGRTPDDETVSQILEQRLLLQIGFTDLLLGKVIRRLKRDGIWDEAIVAVTADHGVSFQPGRPRRVPNKANLADIASVPLIIKGPGVPAGKVDERLARTIDLLPTIAQILNVPLPPGVRGSSLLEPPPERADVRVEDRYKRVIAKSKRNFERQRSTVLAQKVRLFGSDSGWARVYRPGPYGDLVGRRVSDLPSDPAGQGTVTLASPEAFDSVDPEAGFVPGAIRARFSGLGAGEPIAVAVNGRIATVTATYPAGEGTRALAVVPPTAFKPGVNSVQVLSIGAGSPPRLGPLGGANTP